MNLVGLMLVRNSDWVIGLTLRAALLWCDSVVVLMHNCTDGTADIVAEVSRETGGRVAALVDDSAEWEEMRLRQTMLEAGRLLGGTHFALIDDDELLTGNLLPGIRRAFEVCPIYQVLSLPWLQYRPDGLVMGSGIWANQNVSFGFRDASERHWRAVDGYDYHHRDPYGFQFLRYAPLSDRSGGVMHFQFADRRRLLAKQFLYQLSEMKRWPGRKSASEVAAYYSRTVLEADNAVGVPDVEEWWEPYRQWFYCLRVQAEPWQESECKRLLAENPNLAAGLNDFGLLAEWNSAK